MDIKLVMFKANGQRREFVVNRPGTTIGRSTECELQIPLGIVSRRHCQITFDGESLMVRDLGSSNGTMVNDKRVQEAALKAGDKIVVGPVIFTVTIDGKPAEIKPVRTVIVEHAVEPVNNSAESVPTIDADSEDEVAAPQDPLAALQALSRKKK